MDEGDWLVERFQTHRAHLHAVAYRMLGSLSEADDAVQEAWLRLSRAGSGGVDDLGRWLTTVVARVCLDMLRSRAARREEPLGVHLPDPIIGRPDAPDPEQEALLGDAVGLALLVVLEELAPAERLALVLHDPFAVPFEEIAAILGRSPAAARQLASRARRRVRASTTLPDADLARQRRVVDAFLAAARNGDLDAHAHHVVLPLGEPRRISGIPKDLRRRAGNVDVGHDRRHGFPPCHIGSCWPVTVITDQHEGM